MELKRPFIGLTITSPSLLIVPYGIETEVFYVDALEGISFNRTLWN